MVPVLRFPTLYLISSGAYDAYFTIDVHYLKLNRSYPPIQSFVISNGFQNGCLRYCAVLEYVHWTKKMKYMCRYA